MQSVIMHIDMNSYFASVEQQENLAWRGKPVGVCEHLGGIIIAASVQAKKWGIKTGTPVWEAVKLYPKIILTQTHPDRYRHYSQRFVKVVGDYTDKVERYSIDEVFLDVTASCNVKIPISHFQFPNKFQISNIKFQKLLRPTYILGKEIMPQADPFMEAVKIAKEIKRRITSEVGDYLTCSIGIAENKLQAKIASDLKKPDGLAVINDKNNKNDKNGYACVFLSKHQLYNLLRLTDVPGIGSRMEKRLNGLGIKTLLDLKNYPKSRLVALFGLPGHHLYNLGQLEGSFKPEVEEDEDIKSMGHMYTLPKEFRKPEYFAPVLYKLSEMVAARLRRANLEGGVLCFYEYDGRQGFGRSKRLGYPVSEGKEIFSEALNIWEELNRKSAEVRLIGITVGSLRPASGQLSLFGGVERQQRVAKALDKINAKYGDFTLCRAPVLKAANVFKDSIGFGRLREN
ncbi:MAG: DNA polymerase IV [Patescibacteria group bacterium]|nr:DNA polymerase IV [Patescibacteria group bacterium]